MFRVEMLRHLGLVVVEVLAADEAPVEAPLLKVGEELVVVHLAGHPEEAVATMVVVPEVLAVKGSNLNLIVQSLHGFSVNMTPHTSLVQGAYTHIITQGERGSFYPGRSVIMLSLSVMLSHLSKYWRSHIPHL